MKRIYLFSFTLLLLAVACTKEQINQTLNGNQSLTNDEIIAGLKEALHVGTDTSVSILNKVDGYYRDELVKILLPEEAIPVYDKIAAIPGGQTLLDNTLLAMNRAAEDAAVRAQPIFVDAITGMTISDGLGILNGSDTAATHYLSDKTYSPLKNTFRPSIDSSLAKPLVLGLSASSTYSNLVDAYNTASLNGILWPKISTNSLGDHVTTKALDGLFLKVAAQEKKIRQDPLAQVTDLLKKVFAKK